MFDTHASHVNKILQINIPINTNISLSEICAVHLILLHLSEA